MSASSTLVESLEWSRVAPHSQESALGQGVLLVAGLALWACVAVGARAMRRDLAPRSRSILTRATLACAAAAAATTLFLGAVAWPGSAPEAVPSAAFVVAALALGTLALYAVLAAAAAIAQALRGPRASLAPVALASAAIVGVAVFLAVASAFAQTP